MRNGSAVETPSELRDLDQFVNGVLADWNAAGVAVAVAKDGEIVLLEGFGRRNVAEDLPVTTKTIFAIGSATKAFTTTSLAMLADDGRLDWDEPVRTYLPDFAVYDPAVTERLTPRDMVTHRSGLPRHDALWYGSAFSREEMVRRLRYLEPTKDLRTVWQYQNLMYLTAGYLAGRIAGCEWDELVQTRIFDPLGMTDSNFSVSQSQQMPDHALPYVEKEGELKPVPFRDIDAVGPAGSINSSIENMSRWLLLNLNGGAHDGKRLISEGQIRQLHAPQMVMPPLLGTYEETALQSYGMGWMIESYRGHVHVEHGGNIDGFSALVSFLPNDGIGVVVLSNLGSAPIPRTIAYGVYDRLLGLSPVSWNERWLKERDETRQAAKEGKERIVAERVPNTSPSHSFADYTGSYAHPGYGRLTIEQDGDGLTLHFNALTGPLEHRHYDIFEFEFPLTGVRYPLNFAGDVAGDIVSVAVPLEPTVKEIVFVKQPPAEMLEERFLEQFAGLYDFQGETMVVSFKDASTLQLAIPGIPVADLVPRRGTAFWVRDRPAFRIAFNQDADGTVTGAELTTPYGVYTTPKLAGDAA